MLSQRGQSELFCSACFSPWACNNNNVSCSSSQTNGNVTKPQVRQLEHRPRWPWSRKFCQCVSTGHDVAAAASRKTPRTHTPASNQLKLSLGMTSAGAQGAGQRYDTWRGGEWLTAKGTRTRCVKTISQSCQLCFRSLILNSLFPATG